MKCDKCGYSDNGTGDWAHACGPVAIQRKPVANTRIRELINEATSFKEGLIEGKYDIEVFDKQKFAELIVRDLIDSMIKRYGDDDELPIQEIKLFVKEHFGVEE
jgi:hypothetical protein